MAIQTWVHTNQALAQPIQPHQSIVYPQNRSSEVGAKVWDLHGFPWHLQETQQLGRGCQRCDARPATALGLAAWPTVRGCLREEISAPRSFWSAEWNTVFIAEELQCPALSSFRMLEDVVSDSLHSSLCWRQGCFPESSGDVWAPRRLLPQKCVAYALERITPPCLVFELWPMAWKSPTCLTYITWHYWGPWWYDWNISLEKCS